MAARNTALLRERRLEEYYQFNAEASILELEEHVQELEGEGRGYDYEELVQARDELSLEWRALSSNQRRNLEAPIRVRRADAAARAFAARVVTPNLHSGLVLTESALAGAGIDTTSMASVTTSVAWNDSLTRRPQGLH